MAKRKLGRAWTGPFRVEEVPTPNNVVIRKTPAARAIRVHCDALKPHFGPVPQCWRQHLEAPPEPTEDPGAPEGDGLAAAGLEGEGEHQEAGEEQLQGEGDPQEAESEQGEDEHQQTDNKTDSGAGAEQSEDDSPESHPAPEAPGRRART